VAADETGATYQKKAHDGAHPSTNRADGPGRDGAQWPEHLDLDDAALKSTLAGLVATGTAARLRKHPRRAKAESSSFPALTRRGA
jgi:hypothetical protein